MRYSAPATLLLVALASSALPAPAQPSAIRSLGPGTLLVASRELKDPNFAERVVLLVHFDDEGVMGLVINDRTDITLARALQEVKGAKDRRDTVYVGGPVGRTGVVALLRSRSRPESAEHISGDLYLVSSREQLEKTLAAGVDANALHVYLGYSGWAVDQLRAEVRLGAWHIFPSDARTVFDAEPESVWPRLIRKTEEQIARTLLPPVQPVLDRAGETDPPATAPSGRSSVTTRTRAATDGFPD